MKCILGFLLGVFVDKGQDIKLQQFWKPTIMWSNHSSGAFYFVTFAQNMTLWNLEYTPPKVCYQYFQGSQPFVYTTFSSIYISFPNPPGLLRIFNSFFFHDQKSDPRLSPFFHPNKNFQRRIFLCMERSMIFLWFLAASKNRKSGNLDFKPTRWAPDGPRANRCKWNYNCYK